MSHPTPSSSTPGSSESSLQSIGRLGISQSAISCEWQPEQSRHTTASVHILNDDSLLNIFYLYRLAILGGEDDIAILGEGRPWTGETWWYKLAHICQRWRNLILGSASNLGLCLVCTFGTPVADMLDHSPPLPLIVDYDVYDGYITAEDEEEIILSLEQRDRVRRIRLRLPVQTLEKLIVAINDEYPILEHLMLVSPKQGNTILILPETLQAPHLRHLVLGGFSLPIGSRLLTTAVGLVTICLAIIHPSTYIHPNTLLRWISFMPQLETLLVMFSFPVLNHDVERQLTRTPITTHVALPNPLTLVFRGASAYMEAVVRHVTPPRLEKLEIYFFNQLTFSIPCLLQLMNTTENLKFGRAKILFSDKGVDVVVYPHEAKTCAISIEVYCWHLDWQVSSAAQIFNALSPKFSEVEHLTFEHEVHIWSSGEEHDEVDRTEWCKLLRSFNTVKTLSVDEGLVRELSCCLQLDDGELLPELQELTFSGIDDIDDLFTQLIDSRKNAGRPVIVTHR